jgi:hypothetical protein
MFLDQDIQGQKNELYVSNNLKLYDEIKFLSEQKLSVQNSM